MAPGGQWKVKDGSGDRSSGKGKGGGGEEKGKRKGGSGKGESGGKHKDKVEKEKDADTELHEENEEAPAKEKGSRKGDGRKGNKGHAGNSGGVALVPALAGGQPPGEGRSALNTAAPSFEPAAFGSYGTYDESTYWGWQGTPIVALPLWREFSDADGTPYYYNSKTGLCQWERPTELNPPKAAPASAPAPEAPEEKPARDHARTREPAQGKGEDGRGRRTDGERGGKSSGRDREPREGQKGEGGKGNSKDGGRDGDRGRRRKPDEEGKGGGKKGQQQQHQQQDPGEFGPPGCNLFVFHLPDDWTDDDLHEYFAPHGNVVSAKVMKELGTGRSRGFGFVSYEDRVSAATAIKKMQGYKILGKRLKVEFKKGEGESNKEVNEPGDEETDGKKAFPDDERLIGYLRAISAKNVVQSLKESEGAAAAAATATENGGDDDDDNDAPAGDAGNGGVAPDDEDEDHS